MKKIRVADSLINFFSKLFHKKIYLDYSARILLDSFLFIIIMIINVNLLKSKITVVAIIFSIIMLIISVMFVLEVLELLDMLIPKTTEYDKKVMGILNKYNDCIVEINTYKDFASKEIEKVYSFDALLEERGSLKIPIMYYNIIDHLKCNFYIKKNKKIYVYVLKAIDMEK